MSWEDHVVECKNKQTGKTGKFLLSSNAPLVTSSYKYRGLPYGGPKLEGYYPGEPKVWEYNEYAKDWRFTKVEIAKDKGWDLRPLEMHENKPHEKAVIAYNQAEDAYVWFINEQDLTDERVHGVFRLTRNYFGRFWNLKSQTHETKEYWEEHGWVFEKIKKDENVEVLQQKLIEYCALKSTRATHLVKLTQLGALNNSATYDEVATIVRDYLNTEYSVCTDGADRAIKALGLAPKKFVVYELTRDEINERQARTNEYPHFVGYKDSDLGEFDINQIKNFTSNALMKVGYYE